MLLEIVTRHLSTRPKLLAQNQASLQALASDDWKQTLLVDDVGRGVDWANEQLQNFEPTGDWVWVLDDDDECIYPGLIEGLTAIVDRCQPDAVMVRMDHSAAGLGILPHINDWHGQLREGGVGCSALISSRETWMKHRNAYGARYAGDFDYIHAVQESGANIFWWNAIVSRVGKRMMGAGE